MKMFHTPRALVLAGCVFALGTGLGALAGGCGHGEAPRIRVVNASGQRVNGLWVRTQTDSTRVPALAPGESAEVRVRVKGEALLWVSGTVNGRPVASHGGEYVEGSGGYRFRATIDSTGNVQLKFIRLAIW
jgi:hypothetical protein